MNPLILQFKETPTKISLDYSLLEYSENLNLSVTKSTMKPAIEILDMGTETFTKVQGEESDSDAPNYEALLDTETGTRILTENSDSDNDIIAQLDTTTQTFVSQEGSDEDPGRQYIQALIDTSTLTESNEVTDQDTDLK